MCTVSWFGTPSGYELFCNRDERRSRRPAVPPLVHGGSPRWIAPLDGDCGGTWFAVNERGVTLCLLNGAPGPDDPPPGGPSRGWLLTDLAGAADARAALARLDRLPLDRYRSFLLLLLQPGEPARLARWATGNVLSRDLAPEPPLVSSSFDTEEIRRNRVRVFRRLGPAPATLAGLRARHLAFHAGHEPAPGPESVCMHRPEAATVSFSWVAVEADRIRLRYAPHAPCAGPPGPALVLARNA